MPISAERLQQWRKAGLSPSIKLPEANHFIATDFQLSDAEAEDITVPRLLVDKPRFKLWFKNDNEFNVPKGFLSVSIRSADSKKTLQKTALLRIYEAMLNEQLSELSYPAALAGLHYSLRSHMRGLTLKVSGFNEKQAGLFDALLAALKQPEFPAQRFERIKKDLLSQLANAKKQQPYRLLMADLSKLLYKPLWSEQKMAMAIEAINIEMLQEYAASFLIDVDLEALIYGNYSQSTAELFAERMAQTLLADGDSEVDLLIPTIDVAQLGDSSLAYKVQSEYQDAALLYYLQAADNDKQTRAAFGIAAQLFKPDFYTQLRTEKQLGYIVSSGAYPVYDVPGLFFVVQSPVAGAVSLQQEIMAFIDHKFQAIADLPEAEFIKAQQVLVKRLTEKPTNMAEAAGRYWQDISYGYRGFDSRAQLVKALQRQDFSQWKRLVNKQLFNSKHSLLLYSAGQFSDQQTLAVPHIDELEAFKANQSFYSFQ